MVERTLNWGPDAATAQYQTGEDQATGNFVVAEDTDGGTILLEYDETAGEWVSRGPVNMSGNDISNVGTIDAAAANIEKIATTGLTWTNVADSRSFDTWYQAPSDRDIEFTVIVQTSASSTLVTMNVSVNDTQNTMVVGYPKETVDNGNRLQTATLRVPASHYYRVAQFGDTGSYSIDRWFELR